MRKNFGVKPAVYPMPVFIIGTYDGDGIPNAMNAAWGGISEENEISICISANHKTTYNLLETKAFTVSMATRETVAECDFLGMASGNDSNDKIAKCGFTATKSELVNAPLFDRLPMALECKLKSYDPGTCRLVGEIVNVSAEESILGDDGQIDLDKFHPITFDPIHDTYRELGAQVGVAFSDGQKI